MATPKEYRAKNTQRRVMGEKANESPMIYAQVGDGGGTVATGRANFYYIRLRGDENRVTQCYSLVPLADGDLIYVRQSQDRKLRWYEFVEFIQAAGGGTGPPVPVHNVLGAYHGDAATAAVAQGDVLIGDATPEINRLPIGNAHEIFKVNAGGTDPGWEPFDWDEMATPAGADMVHDHSAAAEGGQDLRQILEFEFDDASLLTIDVNGTITRTQAYHVVAANAGVADNLDQIDGGVEGDNLVIRPDMGDTITVRHNAGGAGDNIWLAGGADIVLDNDDHLWLIYDGTWWCDTSGGAGGLVVHDHSGALAGGDDLNPETISTRTLIVGTGCPYTTLGAAVAAVPGVPCTIKIMGITTAEVAGITIPADVAVVGMDEGSVIGMGAFTLSMSDDSSLLNIRVTSTNNDAIDANNADCIMQGVRVSAAGAGIGVRIRGDSEVYLYDVIVDTPTALTTAFSVEGTAIAHMYDCHAEDAVSIVTGLSITTTVPGYVDTRYCTFRGGGADVTLAVGSTWAHVCCFVNYANCTLNGTEYPNPQTPISLNGWPDALILDADEDTTISAPNDDQIDFEVGGSDKGFLIPAGWEGDAFAFIVKNTSGGAAVANDVGYIDSAGEYKTTTTAYNDVNWCVVLTGGANNADIYVTRRGRVTVTLNGNCSAGDYLYTSTTAGQAQPQSYMRREVFAVALTANGAGAGGTCSALLLCHTKYVNVTSSIDILLLHLTDSSDWRTTINGAPVGAVVTYAVPLTSGNENTIDPTAANQYGKIRLYNETDADYALIDDVNQAANTITLTANAPAGWAHGETITTRSQTCVYPAAPPYFYDIDLTSADNTLIPVTARVLEIEAAARDTAAAQAVVYLHPWEAYAASSVKQVPSYEANVYTFRPVPVPLIQRRFCVLFFASGAATATTALRVSGWWEAAP